MKIFMIYSHFRKYLTFATFCILGVLLNGTLTFADINDWGPFLQKLSPNSVLIKWRVPTSQVSNNSVHYGTSSGSLTSTVTDSSPASKSCGYCPESWREFEVTLSSLSPNTRYYYAIGTSSTPSVESKFNGTFKTFPTPGTPTPTRIWVIGDSGTNDTKALVVADRFKEFSKSRDPDVWLMLGDNAYEDGTDRDNHGAVFLMYPDFLKNVAVWPTFGNHDARSATSGNESGVYFNIWELPRNGEIGGVSSGTEAYYSFDHGNIHFVVLDSFGHSRTPGSSMLTWLENDLIANDKEWLIAYWHHPAYSKGSHNSDAESILIQMRENVVPILEQYGVDLVLMGHSHSYERSLFLNGHYGSSSEINSNPSLVLDPGNGRPDPEIDAQGGYTKFLNPDGSKMGNDGAVYVVAGSSGQVTGGSLNHPAMFHSINKLGSLVLDVFENRLEAVFLDAFGKAEDKFSIIHDLNNFPPGIFSVHAPNPLTLEVQFSEPLEKISAESVSNYSMNNGVTISAAKLLSDFRTVRLLTTPLNNSVNYTLTATGVADYDTNTSIPSPGTAFSFVPGFKDPLEYTSSFQDGYFPHEGYDGTKDSFIFEGDPNEKYGTKIELLSHGPFENAIEGDAITLVSWDISSIPSNAIVQSATVYFDLFNRSETSYHLHQILTSWNEFSVTWNNIGGSSNISNTIMGTLAPQKFGLNIIPLNQDGLDVVQGWIDGSISNNGLAVENGGPGEHPNWWNAIRMWSRRTENRPRISITYTLSSPGDNINPSILAPSDITIDSTGNLTPVFLGTADAVDNIGSPTITNDAPAGGFALGTTLVTWTATDAAGNTGTDIQKVTVKVPATTTPNTISFQDGVEPSSAYFGTSDSRIRSSSRNSNDADGLEIGTDGDEQFPPGGLFGDVDSVFKWDTSAIPKTATIDSVSVTFNIFNSSSSNHSLYEIKTKWDEETATWNSIIDSSFIGSQVGTIPASSSGVTTVNLNQNGIDLVQGWVNESIPNNGFRIANVGGKQDLRMHSSEATIATRRPKINISYSVPPPNQFTLEFQSGIEDAILRETSPNSNYPNDPSLNADGSQSDPGNGSLGESMSVISWDITAIPNNATIQSASITFNLTNISSGTYNLHQALTNWAEGTVTWNNFGGGTANVGSSVIGALPTGPFGNNLINLNTDGINLIQGWIDGSIPNNGIVVKTGGTNDGIFFNSSEATSNRPKLSITYLIPLEPDTEPPVVTAPGDITTLDPTPNIGSASATDNVGVTSLTNDAPTTFSLGTTTVTWTAMDAAGNSGTDTQDITLQTDTEDPVVTAPADISTTDAAPNLGTATATDNSGIIDTLTNDAPGSFPVGTTIVTWSATDPAGNIGTDTQSVTIIPTSGPTTREFQDGVEPDSSYSGTEDAELRETSPNLNNGNSTSLNPDGSDSDPSNGSLGQIIVPISWDISTIPGNATVSSASISLNLTNISSGPYNLFQVLTNSWTEGTVTWNSFGGATANVGSTVIGIISTGQFGENIINLNSSGINMVQGWVDGSIPNNGIVIKTGGTNDGIDFNSSEASSGRPKLSITYTTPLVEDTEDPVVTAPADVTTLDPTPDIGTATATDNVGVTSLTNDAPAIFPLGTTTVTWTAMDAAGNSGADTQDVTLLDDTEDPVVAAPADITTTDPSPNLGTATATDNSGIIDSLTNDAPGTFPFGTTVVTWTATDPAGNTGTDTQNVTLQVPTGPVTVEFQDGVEPDSGYSGTQDSLLRQTSPNTNYGNQTSLSADLIQPDPSNGAFGEVISVISWDISSIPGNATVQSVSVSLNLSNVSSDSYNLHQGQTNWDESTVTWNTFGGSSANVGTLVLGSIIPGQFGENVINLNSNGINLVQGWINGTINNNGIVIKEANNNNDGIFVNSSEAGSGRPKLSITYTVPSGPDTEDPVVTAPADLTTMDPTPDIGTATATDNVGVTSLTNDAPATFPLGTTTVTWTAMDAAGNSGTDTHDVTLLDDTEDPVVTAPADITTTNATPNIGTATATDNSGIIDSLTNDAPGTFPIGFTIVTWTATDPAGNTGTDTQNIIIQPTSGPVIAEFQNGVEPDSGYSGTQDSLLRETSPNTTHGNQTSLSADLIQPDPSNGAFGEVISLISWDISSISSDATVQSVSISLNLSNVSTDLFNLHQALTNWNESTVTWNTFGGSSTNVGTSVLGAISSGQFGENVINLNSNGISLVQGWIDGTINNNGIVIKETNNNNDGIFINSSEAGSGRPKLTITYETAVSDTIPPVVTAPADITTEATGPTTTVALGTGTAFDNFDGPLTPTNNAPSSFPVGLTVVTWSATDAAGNTGTDTQNVTITDTTPPTVTAPADITTSDTTPDLGTATATDLVDGSITPTNNAPATFPLGLTVVTWSATDNATNTGTATQNVTIVTDTTPPVVTAPADITTEATGPTTTVALGTATANDETDGPLTPANNAPSSFPVGLTVVTWSATDAAGNTGTDTQNVTINDTTLPVVTAPIDITTEATGPTTTVALGTGTATDIVDGPIIPTNDAPAGGFSVGPTLVTWSATDNAGNTGTDMQNVTIADTTPPVVTAPPDITTTDTTPDLGTATATDLVDGSITPTNDSPGTFPLGLTIVTWSATDIAGNTGMDTQNVTIEE